MKRRTFLLTSVPTAFALSSLGATLPTRSRSARAEAAVDAKIEIAWPHDRQGNPSPVASAPLVNAEVYLFQRGTLNPVGCNFGNPVVLQMAREFFTLRNGQPAPPVFVEPDHDLSTAPGSVTGQRITRTVDGKTFPVWIFNDVPVRFPLFPGQPVYPGPVQTYFTVSVDGADYRSNVWSHGAYGLTLEPNAIGAPKDVGTSAPDTVDALIQIVWPHDPRGNVQPVTRAPLANVAVDLAVHPAGSITNPTWTSVGFGFSRPVWLLRAVNNGFLEQMKTADQVIRFTTANPVPGGAAVTRPRWVFNDVDVAPAEDPANKIFFAVAIDGVTTHTTIWAHGSDPRTYFPRRDVPTSGGMSCS